MSEVQLARTDAHRFREWLATGRRAVILPTGALEQHGPHLPLDTDLRIARLLVDGVAGRRDDLVIAPPLTVGASGEHQSFPGTLSIGTEVLVGVIVELEEAARGRHLRSSGTGMHRPQLRGLVLWPRCNASELSRCWHWGT